MSIAIGYKVVARPAVDGEVIHLDYGIDGHDLGHGSGTTCIVTVYLPDLNETRKFAIEDLVVPPQGP